MKREYPQRPAARCRKTA